MLKKLIVHNKIYMSVAFFLAVMTIYAVFSYQYSKNIILKNMDAKLLSTAMASHVIVGDTLPDKAKDGSSVSPQEDFDYILLLSKFAKVSDVKYIYFLTLEQNTTRFITSSGTDEEIATGKQLTRYYDRYDYNQNIINAFKTQKTTFDAGISDKWGRFRSVFVPYTTSQGKLYVIGVDIDLNLIEALSRESALREIWKLLLVLLSLTPILYLIRLVRQDNTILRQKVDETTLTLEELNLALQDQANAKTQELVDRLHKDSLTNLPNRDQLQKDISSLDRVAIAIIDIDDFKDINDFFGTTVGDFILVQFSQFLSSFHRAYRLSGDQFALIFNSDYSLGAIQDVLESLLTTTEKKHFYIDSQQIGLRLSIGVAFGDSASLITADIAIHQAKTNKIPIAIYNEDENIREKMQKNLIMADTIKQAIVGSRVVCYFQPIFSCKHGGIEKYETLVRIIDENNTIIQPIEFLELSKKIKYYSQITQEVIWLACEAFRTRTEEFSVNLSSSDIIDPSMVDFILQTIKKTGTADRITFEILESEGIEEFDKVSSFIETIKALGGRVAIDDFGSGYSNFENILKLNIDYIKIDGSLIKHIDTNLRHAIVVETIVDFAKKIGAKTIAEYVCDEDVYAKIQELGIDYAQGYFIGKPDILP